MPQQVLNPYDPAWSLGNPYQPLPPIQQPYMPGTPLPPPMQAPLQYPYNPYQAYQPGGAFQAPGPQPMGPPGQPYPTILPTGQPFYAPPRKPMLSPGAVATLRTVAITFLSLSVLFLLVMVVLMYLTGEWHPTVPGEQSTPRIQQGRNVSQPTVTPNEAPQTLEQEGLTEFDHAKTDGTPEAWDNAAQKLEFAQSAYARIGQTQAANRVGQSAAEARYNAALLLEDSNPRNARSDLYVAREDVDPQTPLADQIDTEIKKLISK